MFEIDWLEIIGFVSAIICVYLNTRQNIWGWPIAMVSVVMYTIVFFNAKLYGDASLQIFFLILNFYGWYKWFTKNDNGKELAVSSSSLFDWIYILLSIIFLNAILYWFLDNYTDSDVPFMDSTTTALSVVAQILLGRKKIENWILWIVANIIYIGLFVHKHLYVTSVLYLILLFLAVYGWMSWNKSLKLNISKDSND
ncbi:MAG: nicotinamide riboside transporter PnuC [Bacteroidota bacterium]|nr:nicotinamide riboside transporter PnuC [Bacteroidota bacterium]